VSPFDEPDWPLIRVRAWAWLRNRKVVDDPNLTPIRLAMHGSGVSAHAPVERPAEAADPPLPKGFELAPAPSNIDPTLPTFNAVEIEILTASRSGRLRWSGRLGKSGKRRMVPELEFIDGRFDDNGALNMPGHTWYDCRAERAQILELWPETSAVVPPPSAPSSPTPAPQPSPAPTKPLSLPQLVSLAKQYHRDCAATGRPPSIAAFARANNVSPKVGKRAWLAAGLPMTRHGGARRKSCAEQVAGNLKSKLET